MMKTCMLRTAAALVAAVLLYPINAFAVSARKAILVDGYTGRVLYEKRADDRSLIASTTKIMTSFLICRQCNVLDQVRIPEEAVGIEGSSMYLRKGEILSVQELLYGLMLSSGNDAAIALAIHCSGTVEAFVQLMNEEASSMGLADTHFANPHGLDAPGHYSTAQDLAKLASIAMQDPIFAQTVGTKSINMGERYLTNHNKLLWQVDGAEGVKTGYTKAAGRILVSSAKRDGRRLVCVTIDDRNDWLDHKNLYETGFSQFRSTVFLQAGQLVGALAVFGGVEAEVELMATENFTCAITSEETVSFELSVKEFVYAPVAQGADAGYVYICVDGCAVGKVPVVFATTVEQQKLEKKGFWERIFGGRS